MNLQQLFSELSSNLYTKTFDNSGDRVLLKENSPEWMTEVIYAAHDGAMPNDTIYSFVEKVADHLADVLTEDSDNDEAREALHEIEPDVYTAGLTKWLHESLSHASYLTEALEEYGMTDGFQALAMAQSLQIQEIGELLVSAMSELEFDDDDDDDEC